MPPYKRTLTRAVIPTLALLASGSAAAAAAGVPEVAPAPSTPAVSGGAALPDPPAATTPAPGGRLVEVVSRQLAFSTGRTVSVRGRAHAPVVATLRVGSGGRAIARATVAAGHRFQLRGEVPRGTEVHITAHRTDGVDDRDDVVVGTVQRLRATVASWYGPGLYGNRTACGQTLTPGLKGVAHKSLPCGTELTVKFRGRTTRATVVDRGPYVGGREFDLTNGTAQALGFHHVGRVWVSAG